MRNRRGLLHRILAFYCRYPFATTFVLFVAMETLYICIRDLRLFEVPFRDRFFLDPFYRIYRMFRVEHLLRGLACGFCFGAEKAFSRKQKLFFVTLLLLLHEFIPVMAEHGRFILNVFLPELAGGLVVAALVHRYRPVIFRCISGTFTRCQRFLEPYL